MPSPPPLPHALTPNPTPTSQVSPPGSTITILSQPGAAPPANAASALRRCRLEQVEADPTRVEDLRQMQLGKIDSILVLQVRSK